MSDRFPVLVERFAGTQPFTVGCEGCGAEHVHVDVDAFITAIDSGRCSRCGSGDLRPAYEEAAACPGCGELSVELDPNGPLNGSCSRRCMLQVEYATSLGVNRAGF